MQQELIEMLEEIIQYVEIWNAHDQGIIDKAEALVKKAKNYEKESAVPQGWTDDQVISFASMILMQGNRSDSIEIRLQQFREHEKLRGNTTPAPSQPMTDEEKQALVYEKLLACLHCGAPLQEPVTLTDEVLEPIVKAIWDSGFAACRDTEIVGTHAQELAWGCVAANVVDKAERAIIAAMREKQGGV